MDAQGREFPAGYYVRATYDDSGDTFQVFLRKDDAWYYLSDGWGTGGDAYWLPTDDEYVLPSSGSLLYLSSPSGKVQKVVRP